MNELDLTLKLLRELAEVVQPYAPFLSSVGVHFITQEIKNKRGISGKEAKALWIILAGFATVLNLILENEIHAGLTIESISSIGGMIIGGTATYYAIFKRNAEGLIDE